MTYQMPELLSTSQVADMHDDASSDLPEAMPTKPIEFELIPAGKAGRNSSDRDHSISGAPLLTRRAYETEACSKKIMQYGVLGRVIQISAQMTTHKPPDPRLYLNTNAPFSAVVCGLQGSGKSHTVSVMLENMFVCNYEQIGSLKTPLCGLVLHYGEGGSNTRPCEAAWVGITTVAGVKPPSVKVFVSDSALKTMKRAYAPLGSHIIVEPFKFDRDELDAEAFLSLMCADSTETSPLYMEIFMSILRSLGENFTFSLFISRLDAEKKKLDPKQRGSLQQRMSLLEPFLNKATGSKSSSARSRFAPGQVTVIDLSDPFIDAEWACALFQIIIRLFVRANVCTGKVLVVDEAHKYLTGSQTGLTMSLLTLIREQRHMAMRVIISTQEPTVIPSTILELCGVIILHRFSSPSWWNHLVKHVSTEGSSAIVFQKIRRLNTGEAVVFVPTGLVALADLGSNGSPAPRTVNEDDIEIEGLTYLESGWVLMKTRNRVTADGGGSVLVLPS